MDELDSTYAAAATRAGCPEDQQHNFWAAGYVAQPKQLQFHALAREADAPDGPKEIGFGGARGGAKSHASLAQVALDDCQRYPGLKALFLRSIGKSARESFEDLIEKVCPQFEHCYEPGNSRLVFPNGSRIILGGFRSERDIGKYLGIEYDALVLEEANLLTWDKYRKLGGSIRTSKSGWRERKYLTFNPGGVGHAWVKQRFIIPWRDGEQGGDCRFIFSTYRDNVFLSQSYAEYLEGLTGWLGRAWRDGDWDISAGQFFTTWDRDAHVVEPFRLPRNWRYWLAIDYGFTHYTVALLLGQSGDGEVFVIDEHAERRWLVKRHAQAIKDMVRRNGLEWHWIKGAVAGADVFAKRGTTEATIADQYQAEGLMLDPAQQDRISGAANILDYLGDPRRGTSPRLRIFSRCARVIDTLPMLEHDPHRPEDVLKVDIDEDGNGGDDAYDALRYGLMEAPRRQRAGTLKYA